jgi:hypothetical protein
MKKLPSFAIRGMTMLTRQVDDLKVASTLIEQIEIPSSVFWRSS